MTLSRSSSPRASASACSSARSAASKSSLLSPARARRASARCTPEGSSRERVSSSFLPRPGSPAGLYARAASMVRRRRSARCRRGSGPPPISSSSAAAADAPRAAPPGRRPRSRPQPRRRAASWPAQGAAHVLRSSTSRARSACSSRSPAGADHRRHALREQRVREAHAVGGDLDHAGRDRAVEPFAHPVRLCRECLEHAHGGVPQQGGRLEQAPHGPLQTGEPLPGQGLQRTPASEATLRGSCSAQRPHELQRVEGVAARQLVDALQHRSRQRTTRVEPDHPVQRPGAQRADREAHHSLRRQRLDQLRLLQACGRPAATRPASPARRSACETRTPARPPSRDRATEPCRRLEDPHARGA